MDFKTLKWKGGASMKGCKRCGQEKAFEDFGKHSGTKDGLNTVCLECSREYQRDRYKRKKREKQIEQEIPKLRKNLEEFFAENSVSMNEERHQLMKAVLDSPMTSDQKDKLIELLLYIVEEG